MGKANNFPTNWKDKLSEEEKTNLLSLFDEFRKMSPVKKDEPEEINKRLDLYFKSCSDSGILPTVEAMSLVLGVSRQSMWKWQQSECEAGKIVERAKAVINSVLTSATMLGAVNPVYSIWLQKNNFNYSDTQVLQLENITERKTLTTAELPKLGEVEHEEEEHTLLSANDLPKIN